MVSLIFWVGLCLLSGFAGSSATLPEITGWYQQIQKPVWTPPDWIFGPVWTFLYILMGLAASRVWSRRKLFPAFYPLCPFMIQLLLNVAWSFIFFKYHRLDLAFYEIVILLFSIVLTIRAFLSVDRVASCLLVPYLLWVSFASLLTFAIWKMN